MIYVLYAAGFLLAIGVVLAALFGVIDAIFGPLYIGHRPVRWRIAQGLGSFLLLSLMLGGLFYSLRDTRNSGPCLQTATGVAYNPGTKTMMPYTYCTQRGEWVK